jgi:Phytanoyl-CoA dioxygenase (PhyH)
MIPYAQLRPGRGFEAARAAAYYSQRLVIEPHARALVTKSIASVLNLKHPRTPRQPAAEFDRDLALFKKDGLIQLPAYPAEYIDRLVQRLKCENVVLQGNVSCPVDQVRPNAASAAYPLHTVLACPEVFSIASNVHVLSIAEAYLGCRATLSSVGIRWSFPTEGKKEDTNFFHRDMDDWRSVKFFVYLTDVTEETGPHTYVRGSHRSVSRLRAKPYTIPEIRRRFGDDAATAVIGPRGTAFLADVYGIHQGTPPRAAPRLILQFQYSILPVYAFSYRPVAMLPPTFDKYLFRLLAN